MAMSGESSSPPGFPRTRGRAGRLPPVRRDRWGGRVLPRVRMPGAQPFERDLLVRFQHHARAGEVLVERVVADGDDRRDARGGLAARPCEESSMASSRAPAGPATSASIVDIGRRLLRRDDVARGDHLEPVSAFGPRLARSRLATFCGVELEAIASRSPSVRASQISWPMSARSGIAPALSSRW